MTTLASRSISPHTSRSDTPILAYAYPDETTAINRAEELKADTNPEYDEVDIFTARLL